MNTPQIRDAQFQQHPHYDDEISLVDLAKTLIKRRWWVISTGFVVIALALAYALANRTGPAYNYISIYQIAEKAPNTALEATAGIIEKTNTLYWPNYRRAYMQKHQLASQGELPFDLEIANPKSTNLLAFTSVSLEENLAETKELHETLINQIIADQNLVLNREKEKINKQIEQTKTFLEQAQIMAENAETPLQITATTEQVISYTTRLFSLEERLEDLSQGKLEYITQQGERAKTKKLSGSLVLALGIVLGGILGIMAAFFAEFAAQVRQSLKEENQAKI